ncbi:hypothetical protein CRUP_005468 [Coryphaenoides rupestris]|nr:hypothetical protein CRUP_005468 [Coryphaenoides rupestris]
MASYLPGSYNNTNCTTQYNNTNCNTQYNNSNNNNCTTQYNDTNCPTHVFEACHSVVSPDKFLAGCIFDSCHMTNPVVQCTSLQVYAAACAQAGVCMYWRNYTTLCPRFPSSSNPVSELHMYLDGAGFHRMEKRGHHQGTHDTIQTSVDGCCKICVEKKKGCKLGYRKVQVLHNGCQAKNEVHMTYCEGACNTFTRYSEFGGRMQHNCACCRELRYSNRTVDLACTNGDVVPFTYIHIEECRCGPTNCDTTTRPLIGRSKRRAAIGV